MARILKPSLITLAMTLALGAVALPAAARGTVATAGTVYPPSDTGCFSEFYGALTNACGGQRVLRFSPSIDSAGYKNVWVFAQGAGPSNNVGCQAFGIDTGATSYYGSPTNYLPAFGAVQTIQVGTWVPQGFSLYVNCYMQNGGRVNSMVHDS